MLPLGGSVTHFTLDKLEDYNIKFYYIMRCEHKQLLHPHFLKKKIFRKKNAGSDYCSNFHRQEGFLAVNIS